MSKKQAKGKKRSWFVTALPVFILILGLGIMAYPTFSDWWNSFHQSRAIASYAAAVEETDPALLKEMLAEAEAYNERLLHRSNRWEFTEEEAAEYEALLDLTGSGVMGYIQINKIGVSLPIYHGTDESVLQVAIGHIEGSSLPVGGENTHAVVSGHRGLPSAKLFTDLDKLSEGDRFTITVLDRVMTYEVDQIRVVLPSEMDDLNIIARGDYVTLVTCTPYGVNTHRLLVRGRRTEEEKSELVILTEAELIPKYITVPVVAIPLLLLFLTAMVFRLRKRRGQ